MKSVLISIRPKWVEKIASGEKTIEVRKTAPKEVPFKGYIYCTYGQENENYMLGKRGKVIGEFVCNKIDEIIPDYNPITKKFYYGYVIDITPTCLSEKEIQNYGGNKPLYFWHISDLKIYDKPKELSEFKTGCKGCKERDTYHCKFYCYGERQITRPPQSYMFVEEVENE